ncbi:MAG TPA: oligosaccharide flippase family protein [Clostridiales bacterium]|nr:oligosaccharide flippase family protein [Clostridiales bacterium]HQP69226.1 oligosaccharide flippase family protein [Clostridiales bacterium]
MANESAIDKKFLKNTGKLFGASFIAQLIPFIILPFLTRIYSPEDFGFWAYFLSLSGLLSIIMTGNYEFAIVLQKDDKDALETASGSILTGIIIFLSALIFMPIYLDVVLSSAGIADKNYGYVILILIMAICMGCYRIMNYWNNRKGRFNTTAQGNITRSVTSSAIQLVNGSLITRNYTGLVSGSVAGYFIGTIVQSKNFIKNFSKHRKEINLKSIKENLIKYKDFPKYFMPSEFMNNLSSNVPVIFLTNMFGSAAAGFYSIPQKFINMPLSMLGSSISQVYYTKASDMKKKDKDISGITEEIYKKLFIIGIVPLSIISAYGDYIFSYFLGSKWGVSGLYASVLAPWMLMVFASSPVSIIFATLEKQKISLKLNFWLLMIRIASFLIGGLIFKSAFTAVFLFGASGFIYWLYLSFYIVSIAGGDRTDVIKFTLKRLTLIMLPIILSRAVIECIL